ncbi:MAG: hypothetical protein IKU96_05155 [Alistipes sp.]|nr:hypothetical protein [Alistipes sp.]
MTTQEQYVARLKEFVEAKFGRSITSLEDCDALSEAVGEATNIKLDSRAFMPIFVHDSRAVAPRPVTLSTLARYLGYNSWSEFCTSSNVLPAEDTDVIPVVRRWGVIILTALAIVVVAGAIIFLIRAVDGDKSKVDNRHLEVVERVEQRWVARTMEECNAMRAYKSDSTYVDMLDAFALEYNELLDVEVLRDIRDAVDGEDISISDENLAAHADTIANRCRAMYNVLYKE